MGLFVPPRHKVSAFSDYTVQIGLLAGLGLGFCGGVRYLTDSPRALPGPFTPVVYQTGEAVLFDGPVRYSLGKSRFAINASNFLDKRYAGRCTGPVGCFFAQGRQVIANPTQGF